MHSFRAVYTGSFDPITLGHLDIIERGAKLFDQLIVGIGINIEKLSMFTLDERIELTENVTAEFGNVRVETFTGLAVQFVRECQAHVMLRGVRPLTDTAAEFTMMMANRQLNPDIETVFLMADAKYSHVSSSLIKQVAPLATDEQLERFVPPLVARKLREKILAGA